MKALIVTGSRDPIWENEVKSQLHPQIGDFDIVLHGGATGADTGAARACAAACCDELLMPAPWDRYRAEGKTRQAGPDRNAAIVHVAKALRFCGYEVSCIAFPDSKSRGTWDMVRRCKAAKIPVEVRKLEVNKTASNR